MSQYSTPKLDALTVCDGYVFEIDSVLEMLMELVDSRQARGKVYALATILLLMLLAKLSGEDSQRGMAQWLAERKEALAELLALAQSPHAESQHVAAYRHRDCLGRAIGKTLWRVSPTLSAHRQRMSF